jgi:threonine/homoserine/homoserine lactone efflux protein
MASDAAFRTCWESLSVLVVGLGLAQVFERYPVTYETMRYGGGAYMLWLAWKIANSGPVGEGKASGSPQTFLQPPFSNG